MMIFNKKEKETHKPLEITDQNFDEVVLKSSVPVLLDMWAPWCGPCQMIGPIIDELAEEFEERALIGKVNIDKNPKIAEAFKIKSIPTIMFLQRDELVERFSGMIPKPNMVEILEELILERKQDVK